MDFFEYDEKKTFYIITDLLISLGGINNTVGTIIARWSFLFLIKFSLLLKGVLHREEKKELREFKFSQMKNQLSEVSITIKKKSEKCNDKEKKEELENDLKLVDYFG